MRLNQYLAHAGLGSRRAVEALITAGRVTLNGGLATLQSRVSVQSDQVALDGKPVRLPDRYTYVLLHKPAGYTVTRDDPHAAQSVYALLPPAFRPLAYVGRLDRDSEGLLLFSDDGELCHRLLLPSYRVEREYRVEVKGPWQPSLGPLLVKGVTFADGPPLAASSVRELRAWSGGAELAVILREGKKREIRRLCAAFGLQVTRLCRVRFGPVELASLAPGTVRELSATEVLSLRELVHLPRNQYPA
jgi:23S rRNA pseudouridine2605 synthase